MVSIQKLSAAAAGRQVAPRLPLIERDDWLGEYCRGKRVLHAGCTDAGITGERLESGRLLHGKLAKVAAGIVGVDIDAAGISELRRAFPGLRFVEQDVERLGDCAPLAGETFDVVLAADLIEHLSNVGLFLDGARRLLAPEGVLLVTTPSAFAVKRMLILAMVGVEHVHPDHTAYFSVQTFASLLRRHGFQLDSTYGFQWRNPTLRNSLMNALLWPVLWLTAGRMSDEVAFVARLDEAGEARSKS